MLYGVGNSKVIGAYSQKEVFFGSLEGKDQIKDEKHKPFKENFPYSLEGREQIKDEKFLKENPFKDKDSFDKSSSNVNEPPKNVDDKNLFKKLDFENYDIDQIEQPEVRLKRGLIVVTQKLYFPGEKLTPHQQRDFDFYFTFMEQQPQSELVKQRLEKLRPFRSIKIPNYDFSFLKKIPKP